MSTWLRKSPAESGSARVPLDPESAAQQLRDFIAAKSKIIQASEIKNDTKLFSSGLLDSLTFIELVIFIEGDFHIRVSNFTDINMSTMDSIGQIVDIILHCKRADQSAK